MALFRHELPQLEGGLFLAYTGMETDLLFNKGVELPGFASYPLLESESGTSLLRKSLEDMINVAAEAGTGVILESPTWVANRDRGAEIGYSPEVLKERNIQSIELMAKVREEEGNLPTVLSATVGPRADAYAPKERMTSDEAEQYHSEQIGTLADTEVDLISGYTVAYPEEAVGMIRAAMRFDLPVIIAFTVETDGRLPTGMPLGEAIQTVDSATDNYAAYFMISCAHPDHFSHVLSDEPWMARLRGIVANASRCSHAELDEAEVLDDGDPEELGYQLAEIRKTAHEADSEGCCRFLRASS